MRPCKYDWPTVEQIYVNAPDDENAPSLKVIGERFGIPYQTVRRRAAANEWANKRLDVIVPQRIQTALDRATNPYIRAGHMRSLERYRKAEESGVLFVR